ncbi:hypothetical protein [Comamonas sp.]|uniref:hypothetical protein n=1 Tax=Comamonas sp. TaxID=34028 RepID=UPI00289B0FE9|nr:hypothetical protein [Comamonas sp.]
MKKLLLSLFVAILALVSNAAWAVLPVTDEWSPGIVTPAEWFNTAQAACGRGVSKRRDDFPGYTIQFKGLDIAPNGSPRACLVESYKNGDYIGELNFGLNWRAGSCPANSDASGGGCVCKTGYSELGGKCVKPDQCEDNYGKPGIVNVTIGWKYKDFGGADGDYTASNYVGGKVNFPDTNKPVCSGGCMATFDQSNPYDAAFHSTVPNSSTGLYRVSVDANVVYGNRACTAEESDTPNSKAADKNTPDEKCDGDLGTIKLGDQPAKKVCVPGADKPVPGSGENVPKKPSDGSTKPEDKGNPPAGPKPETGEGSGTGGGGRTPSAGGGGNKGGPGGASKPGGGTGGGGTGGGTGGEEGGEEGGEDGEEKGGSCGGKDQPPCKIDETGTPDGTGAFDQANAELAAIDAARDSTLGGITNSEGKDTSWGTTFGWVNHGGCAPWMLGTLPPPINRNIEVDICEIEKYTSPIVSFLWIITTVAMCAGLVFSAVSGSKQ